MSEEEKNVTMMEKVAIRGAHPVNREQREEVAMGVEEGVWWSWCDDDAKCTQSSMRRFQTGEGSAWQQRCRIDRRKFRGYLKKKQASVMSSWQEENVTMMEKVAAAVLLIRWTGMKRKKRRSGLRVCDGHDEWWQQTDVGGHGMEDGVEDDDNRELIEESSKKVPRVHQNREFCGELGKSLQCPKKKRTWRWWRR
jgi:hypothetical protein